MQLGAQFWTIREFCKTTEDLSESLKKIADIGYKTIQLSGTCEYDPEWMKEELRKNGLVCVLTHTAPDKIINETEKVIANHKTLGAKYIGLGYRTFKEYSDVTKLIDEFTPAIKTIKANGLTFTYHNHDLEFVKFNGKLVMDHIADAFDPDEVNFTLDTYWVQSGGADPVMWLNKLKGRTPCIHLKDLIFTADKQRRMAVVGEGNLNFDAILKTAVDNGVKFALVEQDECYGEDPFDCLKRSYEYLKAQGLE